MCTIVRKNHTSASNCIGCGKCQKHCPQNIRIPEELEKARKELEGPLYRVMKKAIEILKIF
jgi:predicted aldo/keto reductase-like oxidoreductase